jgi:hypothetical protein
VWVDNASDWLPADEAARTDMGPMSSAAFWREACRRVFGKKSGNYMKKSHFIKIDQVTFSPS